MNVFEDLVARATSAWHARQPRERMMLAAMAVAIATVLYWYGGVVPLRQFAGSAQARHDREAASLAAVRGNLAAIRAARESVPEPPAGDGYAAAILATAQAAGVSISRQRTHGDGGLAVGIDAVDAPTLFAWLDAVRITHGIAPDTLDAGRRDGRLHVEVSFPGRAPHAEPQHD